MTPFAPDPLFAGLTRYAVGGAVRDALLGRPVKDRDWLIVGATPQMLLDRGFKQVGAAFPVFLHPHSGEECALARRERKSGPGYTGFETEFGPEVTLEEDLARRDLTINAMALDADGSLIDPYGGAQDIQARRLRHVSDAFAEDPLRLFRLGRFLARFADLGFAVDPATEALCGELAASGELAHLSPERVWRELQLTLEAVDPAAGIELLARVGGLDHWLPELLALQGQTQPPKYHPEGDAWTHTLLALKSICALTPDPVARFAVLVHDLGKGLTPPELLPSHRGHEISGVPLAEAVCERLRAPTAYRDLARLTVRWHLLGHRCAELRPGTVVDLLDSCDALRKPERFILFTLCCEADARGRGESGTQTPYVAGEFFRKALSACLAIDVSEILARGVQGKAVGEALRQKRVAVVRELRASMTL
ncbi:multifunctional CCA addition/repair protein [Magnetofaba australis]|uniref:Putative tRNA nucleotidyltransferase n=1 Tax=Magnetofaba australis IT-1 TaxID=1434232 RepID=A0A1Y2K5K6_9PROT|nr:multifunctional CCA addition/repair protein [Magnetofaba australis]OSM04820.1 putative tRNA nucleotidyltransferase [Magnetofaba australis IT-1]